MNKLDAVWETHDFVIRKLTENESDYNHQLSQLPIYIEMYEKGFLKKSELVTFIDKAEKTCKSLLSLYHKHLQTIKEINIMIKNENVPPEREVTAEVVDELKGTTLELMEAIQGSTKLLSFLKEEHEL